MDERGWLAITPNWGGMDGADDVMERFRHWPLLYILGGSESVLTTYKKIWEGHLQQYTEAREPLVEVVREGMYYREFCPSFDWEHIGEGMAGWYWYGLARPRDPGYLIRARRFSSFYMNEDPSAPNYDPEHKIIRSLFSGSRGPLLERSENVTVPVSRCPLLRNLIFKTQPGATMRRVAARQC